MGNFLLSVITPTYNSEKNIKKFFESFPLEYSSLIEFIIIDNLSTDCTLNLVEQYKSRFTIFILKESDMGVYDAMNKGVNLSNGKYLFFLNSDDWIETPNFPILIDTLNLNRYDVVSFHQKRWLKSNKYVIDQPSLHNAFHHPLPHQCFIFSKEVVKFVGPYNIELKICADYEFLLKVYLSNFLLKNLDLVISNFSTRGVSSQVSSLYIYYKEVIIIWRKFSLDSRLKIFVFTFKTFTLLLKKLLMP